MANERYDSVLLVAFGGPTPGCCQKYQTCPSEAHCFVEGIVGKAKSQAERVADVASHYTALGGFSPFNELTFQQANALADTLKERDMPVPVYAGFRHWNPYLNEVVSHMARKGHKKILGIIMAPHQSKVSWDWYQDTVRKAIEALDDKKITIDYIKPWWTHQGYISAIAELIKTACNGELDEAMPVFTAHSIPQAAADSSPYTQQFLETAKLVAERLDKTEFAIAYQSQAENTPVKWTQPDINDWIKEQEPGTVKAMVASPIGFLCEHVEILYDLDIEAAETAAACGIKFIRAETVGHHPNFINMLADAVCEKLET